MEYLKKLLKLSSLLLVMALSLAIQPLITSCSASKAFDQGNHDLAIDRAIKKLEKQPNHFKSQEVLNLAYNKMTEKYLPKIEQNKQKNTAASWETVFLSYKELNEIQKDVKGLQSFERLIEHKNYDSEIKEAQNMAAKLYYQEAEELILKDSTQEGYQKAYDKFLKVNNISPGYNDVRDRIIEAKDKGTYHVLIRIQNPNNLALPPNYQKELLSFKPERLNKDWVEFHGLYDLDRFFDYTVEVVLESFSVSRDNQKNKKYTVEKEVLVKMEIVKDDKGNVVKNAKGNVKKKAIYDTKKATVFETTREKDAEIIAKLVFIDNFTMNSFKTVDLKGDYHWSSETANFKGSEAALSDDVVKLAKQKLRPFPSYESMLNAACNDLRSAYVFRLALNRSEFDR